MCIQETHSLSGQPIKVWRRYLRFGVVTSDVSITKIISKYEDYVGAFHSAANAGNAPRNDNSADASYVSSET
jgi:hypothetical protein